MDRTGGVPALVSMLAIQRTADAHGGTASVDASGRGTTISITIPVGV
jgi:signal transduction histidine kinase